jgi:L-fuconolactonase
VTWWWGVRGSFEFEPPEFAASAAMIGGARSAARFGYSVDLVLFERSLPATIQLVESCPEVRFVLDHLGKPRIREGVMHPWREQVAQLAQAPNIVIKISGLITEADRVHWTKEQLKPYIDHAIACFGWDRVLFGSDWPVSTLAGGYDPWVEAAAWATAGADESDRRKFFSENARRVYRF